MALDAPEKLAMHIRQGVDINAKNYGAPKDDPTCEEEAPCLRRPSACLPSPPRAAAIVRMPWRVCERGRIVSLS